MKGCILTFIASTEAKNIFFNYTYQMDFEISVKDTNKCKYY